MAGFRLKAYIFLILSGLVSGIAGPVIKLTLYKLPPDVFLFYRFFVASVFVIFLLPFYKIKLPKKSGLLFEFFLYGFFTTTLTLGLLFWGTAKTSLLDMSIISIVGPIMTIIFGFVFLHDHLAKHAKFGILVAFLGAFIITVGPLLTSHDGSGQIFGNVLIFLCLVTGAISSVIAKELLRKDVDPLSLTNMSFVIAFFSFLIFEIVKGNLRNSISDITHLALPYHLGVLYMALISGTLAYFLGNVAQKSLTVSEVAIFSYLTPVISAICAILILGDKLSFVVIVGTVFTAFGVFLAEWKKKRYNHFV